MAGIQLLRPIASSSISLPTETYIYDIVPTSGALAAISSDDSLRIFDKETLQLLPGIGVQSHKTVTRVARADAVGDFLATAGRDGVVGLWDVRSGKSVARMARNDRAPILSLTSCPDKNYVVTGTELTASQAVVAIWDTRSLDQPILQYSESHNDDVTALEFHPMDNSILLSGSTDGLVNIYDSKITDEDDALVQVINHGSIHHAGFLAERSIFALSHDEAFSIHPLSSPEEEISDIPPTVFGNVRPTLQCDYVVDIVRGPSGSYLAAGSLPTGSTGIPRIDLVPLGVDGEWKFDARKIWRLPKGHGEEVVRSIYLDEESNSIFTAGEDGFVRVWGMAEGSNAIFEQTSTTKISKSKDKGKSKGRYNPY